MYSSYSVRRHHQFSIGRRALSILILSVFLLFMVLLIRQTFAACAAETRPEKYTSIRIEAGDSLWSIAAEHTSDVSEIEYFIKEVRRINNIKGDMLIESQYLVIPVE